MLKEVQVCLKRLDVVGGKSFLQKQGDTGLVKLCSKNLHNCFLFSATPGPPTRGVESRSSPEASYVGSSAPILQGTFRVPGESFTSHSAPLRITRLLHCLIGVISCVLAQWLYPCAMCRYRAFKLMHIFSHVTAMQTVRLN